MLLTKYFCSNCLHLELESFHLEDARFQDSLVVIATAVNDVNS